MTIPLRSISVAGAPDSAFGGRGEKLKQGIRVLLNLKAFQPVQQLVLLT